MTVNIGELAADCIAVVHYPRERHENWMLLEDAARRHNVQLTTWEPHLLTLQITDLGESVFYDGTLANADMIIHRTVSPFSGIVIPVLSCLAAQGTLVLNEIRSAFLTRDKLLTTIVLRQAHVPIVPTAAFDEPSVHDLSALSAEGTLLIKPGHGVRGEGIELVSSSAASALVASRRNGRPTRPESSGYHVVREHYLAQPLIREGGQDLRTYVVGDSCIAAMRRKARAGEVRANLALGASGSPVSLRHPAARVAEAALRACKLDFGAVDLIEDENGVIRVLEVDAWGGFAGITNVTGVDVASGILEYALSRRREKGSVI